MSNPAGWYDDTTTPDQQRWWDGSAWTGATRPAPAEPGMPPPPAGAAPDTSGSPPATTAPPPATDVQDGAMWAIVALPFVVGMLSLYVLPSSIGILVALAWVMTGLLAFADQRATGRSGVAGVVLAVLFAGGYLWMRQKELGRSKAPIAMWLIGAVLPIAIAAMTGAGAVMNTSMVEAEIRRSIQDQTGLSAIVVCPDDQPARAGHRYVCTVTDPVGDTYGATIEVLNTAGDFQWSIN